MPLIQIYLPKVVTASLAPNSHVSRPLNRKGKLRAGV